MVGYPSERLHDPYSSDPVILFLYTGVPYTGSLNCGQSIYRNDLVIGSTGGKVTLDCGGTLPAFISDPTITSFTVFNL